MTDSDSKKLDVLGFGVVAVDDILLVASYPDVDTKTPVETEKRHCGGLAATALVAVSRLGGRAAFAGVLGEDNLSRFVLETLSGEGVDVRHVQKREGARPIHARIVLGKDRQSRNIFYNLAEFATMAAEDIDEEAVRSARVLFVDHVGIEDKTRAAEIALEAGIPRVADFEGGDQPGFSTLLDLIDHPILPRHFAQEITGTTSAEKACQALWTDRRSATVVTDGVEGCWYYDGQGDPAHLPAFHVDAVDTNGCGDVFHGAYAQTLAEGLELEKRVRLASAAAALKATKSGYAGIPDRRTVDAFLHAREQ